MILVSFIIIFLIMFFDGLGINVSVVIYILVLILVILLLVIIFVNIVIEVGVLVMGIVFKKNFLLLRRYLNVWFKFIYCENGEKVKCKCIYYLIFWLLLL